MNNYWPSSQGHALNQEVAELLVRTSIKINRKLTNCSQEVLILDVFRTEVKRNLLKIILTELEKILLEIYNSNLGLNDITTLTENILIDLFHRCVKRFCKLYELDYNNIYQDINDLNYLVCDYKMLLQILIIQLLFGSSQSINKTFNLFTSNVPIKQVEIFLENYLIQLSNIIAHMLVQNFDTVHETNASYLCNVKFLSDRKLEKLKNNLIWNTLVKNYIERPRAIYESRYKVWGFYQEGLNCQYIYACRSNELYTLSSMQILITFLLEVQDFFVPKIQSTIFLIGQIIIYAGQNVFNQIMRTLLEIIRRSSNFQKKSNSL
uniref:hypothetical protein n=1 Tax=Pyropia dentata TaxID=76160 RepID=UPI00286D6913|nr:hypothetical protein RMC00_pgp196 [Neoporphyra dentata]WKD83750.1 hypothetical protein [Neoporphyra dentata]